MGERFEFAADRAGAGWSRARALPFDPGKLSDHPAGIARRDFFSVGWITVTKLFQFYVAKYDRYNPTYLALASIIVLLTWMYLTCLLLLLGGKLNAILRRERERATNAPVATPQPA